MRPDMSRLITECYRDGSGSATPYRTHRRQMNQHQTVDPEDMPKREAIRKWAKLSGNYKEFGEQLNPLKRFILSQVGRPWNKVHSEMSAHINRNSAQQLHIWQHAVDYVETNTYIRRVGKKDQVFFNASYRFRDTVDVPIETSFALVYVCPKSGILKKVPRRSYKNRFKSENTSRRRVIVNETTQLHKIKGIWYEIQLEQFEVKRRWHKYTPAEHQAMVAQGANYHAPGCWQDATPRYSDVAAAQIVEEHNLNHWYLSGGYYWKDGSGNKEFSFAYGRGDVYGKSKRQLNHRELRKHNLTNDPPDVSKKKAA